MGILLLRFLAAGQDAPVITDRDTVDRLYRRHRWRVMLAISLGVVFMYMGRLSIGFAKVPMIHDGIFNAKEFGSIGSALLYTYAIGKLVNGFLADHVNIRRFFAFGILLSGLLNIGMGLTTTLWVAVVLWGLNGWVQSVTAPSGAVSIVSWFGSRERGRVYGTWSAMHSLGEGLSAIVTAWVVAVLGWRFGYFVPAMFCLATAALVYAFAQDRPATLGLPNVGDWKGEGAGPVAEQKVRNILTVQYSVLLRPAIWLLALASAANYVTRFALLSWGPLYLQEERGLSLTMAGILLTVPTFAGVAGSVLYGLTSDWLFAGRRPPANLLFSVVELAGLCLIFFGPRSQTVLIAGLVLVGFGLAGLVTSLGGLFAVDMSPRPAAGAAIGLIGLCSYLAAGVQERVSGALIERGKRGIDAVITHDFGPAIWFWVGSAVVSMVLALTLWRVKPRS